MKQQHPNLIMVDYTVPDVIHDMVDLYIKHRTPFVMGTTGGNRAQILADVQAADLYAVIAPQMGKQVRGAEKESERRLLGVLSAAHKPPWHVRVHVVATCSIVQRARRPGAGGSVVRAVQASRQSGCWARRWLAHTCTHICTLSACVAARCCVCRWLRSRP